MIEITIFVKSNNMSFQLIVENLTKIYSSGRWPFKQKSFTAVDNISFSLKEGEILGFLGKNGAGKTTTIQMLLGTLTATKGNIYYFGKDFFSHRIEILNQIGYASGYDKLPGRLTIQENLDIYGRLYGLSYHDRKSTIKHLLEFFDITSLKDKQAATLSAGQMTRVLLIKAWLSKPKIILLDEPTASLDPDVSLDVIQFVIEQKKQHGTSFLITSHNMAEVTEMCDRIIMMHNGVIIANNTPEMLAQSISDTKVHLMVSQKQEILLQFLKDQKMIFEERLHEIIIHMKEKNIGDFLFSIAQKGIQYAQIAIEPPTLEDYFLAQTKKLKGVKK